MKQLTIIFLMVTILNSCLNDKTSKTESKTTSEVKLIETVLPIIKGVWVLSDYITEIEKTKSPAVSSNKLHGFVTLIIDSKVIGVGSSWANHSGTHFYLYLKTGVNQVNLMTDIPDYNEQTNFYELGYDLAENDTLLFIYHYDKTNKLIDKKQYTKVRNNQLEGDASWGLQYIVNEKIFSGNYILIDSTNSQTKIQFKSDGTLTGFRDFKTYNVWTDFAAPGPDGDISDAIFFTDNTNKSIGFDFEFKTDTLFLKQANLTFKLLRQ